VNKIVEPTRDADVTKFRNLTQWLSDENLDISEGGIAARDEEGICCLLKRLDRVLVDPFGNFNLIANVIAFENALKCCITASHTAYISTGDTCLDEYERAIFGKASIDPVGQDDLFSSLHPLICVQLLFQNEHNIRSSIVDGIKRFILLYKHFLGVDGVIDNGNGLVGVCASYDNNDENNGVSLARPLLAENAVQPHPNDSNEHDDEEEPVPNEAYHNSTRREDHSKSPQQAMEKLVLVVEVLKHAPDFDKKVTARSKLKEENDMREQPLCVGHV
jgi:hypothetical protein